MSGSLEAEDFHMRTTLAGIAAVTLLVAIAVPKPAAAMPIDNLGLTQANATESDYVPVQWRRYHRHRYWGPRAYYGPRHYRAYGYYSSYPRYYAPGPYFHIGPRGFGFGVW